MQTGAGWHLLLLIFNDFLADCWLYLKLELVVVSVFLRTQRELSRKTNPALHNFYLFVFNLMQMVATILPSFACFYIFISVVKAAVLAVQLLKVMDYPLSFTNSHCLLFFFQPKC